VHAFEADDLGLELVQSLPGGIAAAEQVAQRRELRLVQLDLSLGRRLLRRQPDDLVVELADLLMQDLDLAAQRLAPGVEDCLLARAQADERGICVPPGAPPARRCCPCRRARL
jgi:hypothetical protein